MIELGSLVRCQTNNLGIGKVTELSESSANIEYFYSIAQRIQKTLPLSSLSPVKLQRQTRCYVWSKSQESWSIGRIIDWEEDFSKYQLDLPNSQTILAGEADVYVRCNVPISDPIETLAMKGQETPYFHDRRLALMQSLVEQRAISRGLVGLISANIKLYPHQVEVVRRVLQDPIQRYLLADEVGLGKTIEAGVILRQYLLDEPQGRAVVLVPQYLLPQWQAELEAKFYISHFGDRVQVYSLEDANQVSPYAELGLLIIDEAHHLAEMAKSTDAVQRKYFQNCRQLAHKSDRLLLLTASPSLNRKPDLRMLLHLLDPVSYPLDDLERFRKRWQDSENIAGLLRPFCEDGNSSTLKTNLQQLCELIPADAHLAELAETFNSTAAPSNQIIQAIRTHVSETYCLHRRILRNPRAAVADFIYDRNIVPKAEYDLDERGYDVLEIIEKWRTAAPQTDEYRRIFQVLTCAAGSWLVILKMVVTARLQGKSVAVLTQDLGAEDTRILTKTDLFDGEREILQSLEQLLQQPSEDGDRIELLKIVLLYHFAERFGLQSFRSNPTKLLERVQGRIQRPFSGDTFPKIVIFTNFGLAAAEIVRVMQQVFGEAAVTSYLLGRTRAQIEKNLNQFQTKPGCFLLVCDSSGAEGRNFQFVDWTIHFDLPWSPHDLEQRIGRVDRIGRSLNLETTVFAGVDAEDSPHEAWYQLFKDGFGIFQQPMGNLQAYIDEKLPQLEATLFQAGAAGVVEMIPTIQQEIAGVAEIQSLDETQQEYFQALEDYDARHQDIQRAAEGWICQALQLQSRQDVNVDGVLRYQPTARTLVPIDHIKSQFARHLEQSGTYSRQLANANPGVKLYRVGESFIDSLSSYVRWDDRGQAFAMWRTDDAWDAAEGKEWYGFRFNYIVEASLDAVKKVLGDAKPDKTKLKTLKRRADALFPPLMETVFIDARTEEMSLVEDKALLDILRRSYRGKGNRINKDHNLAKERLPLLSQFVADEAWQEFCRQARQTSEQLLCEAHSSFIDLCSQRTTVAEQKLGRLVEQLRSRQARLEQFLSSSHAQLEQEITQESMLTEAIIEGIHQPKIRLDSVGFIVVSGRPPAQIGDGDD